MEKEIEKDLYPISEKDIETLKKGISSDEKD